MLRITILFLILLYQCPAYSFSGTDTGFHSSDYINWQDTTKENQDLYNGKVWRNQFYLVQGNQFLFSNDFIEGTITINGKTFDRVPVKYDICKDEILTPIDKGRILQLNKELIDSFSVTYINKTYHFVRMPEDSTKGRSFFSVLYKGKTGLYLKYTRKIDKLGVEGRYDKFYDNNSIYLMKDGQLYHISNKNDLLNILKEENKRIRDFIRQNNLRVSEKAPDSFIPVVMFYDNLSR